MEPNVVHIRDPVTVVGDIHGQFYDLINIIKLKTNSKSKLLFLGDYVDRGLFSIQVMIVILSMKINSPKTVFTLRGNHQTKQLTTFFNFRQQCIETYNQQIYEEFIQLFCVLPLAAIVNHKFLCIHGGISSNLETLEDLAKIDRFKEVPQNGLFCDLLWADPVQHSQGVLKGMVSFNQTRGCSYIFGYTLTKKILQRNKLSCIIRAHQAKQQGYEMHKWAGRDNFPPLITVFSAPNYCDFYNNKGAILYFENNNLEVTQLSSASHPFYLPNNKTLFEWSMPFIASKVTQMFHFLLKPQTEVAEIDSVMIKLIDRNRIIMQLLKMQQEQSGQRMEDTKYKGKVICEQLLNIEKARNYAKNICQKDFNLERSIDKINEKRPTLKKEQ